MKGLELSRGYYEEFGKPMLETEFPELCASIAVGLVGAGSECYGYDDAVSQDHDFEPGFCLFIPGEDVVDSRAEFRLERAYAKLPSEYCGVKRLRISPVGGNRHGVIRADEFYASKTGFAKGPATLEEWLHIPDYGLSEATNGEVFYDGDGTFSAIRNSLLQMPEDVRLKKLAGNLLLMAQSGQYNYTRCLMHGETGAAQLAVNEFAGSAMAAAFLLNREYMPFYKWRFRALRALPSLWEISDVLEELLMTPNDPEQAERKQEKMEEIAGRVISELQKQEITKAICGDLEKHAYSVNDFVASPGLRNASVLYAV